MGVGKTIQAIALSSLYKEDWPVIIISPTSLKFNWRAEILKWLKDDITGLNIQIISSKKDMIYKTSKFIIGNVNLVSYDMASKLMDRMITQVNPNIMILDEAHYIKNPEAKRTIALLPHIRTRKRVFLLTGTPAFAKPKEIYTLCHAIRPDLFSTFREFGNRYCDPKPSKFYRGISYEGASNTRELHYILTNYVMIRR
jgi:SWI/SNF-related matrix-associated actin-dependent regulator 1 of chromatin subfamily A